MMLVPHFELPHVWPKVVKWLEEAIKINQGDENLFDVGMAINSGIYELWWEDGKFAAVVQIQDFPRQRVATILYAGGALEAFKEMYLVAKKIAKDRGIDVMRVWGRAGWERSLGLKRIGVILQETL
jgi:hypothetical protein